MRVLLQRVAHASVSVDGGLVSRVGVGLLLFVGVAVLEADGAAEMLAEKVVHLRIFPDADAKMNRSLLDVGGEALVVSQFTLYGNVRKGRRPSWTDAGDPAFAAAQVEAFARALEARGVFKVGRGVFGAHMTVELVNDGPVTMLLDASDL